MVKITRQKLYELVWSKPMRDAAATIPMSDRGLKKVCQRYAVPVPPQGYWNKLQAGHLVEPIPLPLESNKPNDVTMLVPGLNVIDRNRRERAARVTPEEREKKKREASAARFASFLLSRQPPAKQPSPPRRPARNTKEAHYVVLIDRWEWNYSFGINNIPKISASRYLDYRLLKIFGNLMRPAKISGSRAELCFMPMTIRVDAHEGEALPEYVGGLQEHPEQNTERYWAHLSMPQDILPSLLPMLVAQRIRCVVLSGSALSRGLASIRRFRFEATVDPDKQPE